MFEKMDEHILHESMLVEDVQEAETTWEQNVYNVGVKATKPSASRITLSDSSANMSYKFLHPRSATVVGVPQVPKIDPRIRCRRKD